MIKGKTLTEREIFDKPRGKIKTGTLKANVEVTATEHNFQWLHLTDGGWVSAGPEQQYIRWDVVSDEEEPPSEPPVTPTNTIIRGRTLVERDIYNEPRGIKVGSIDAGVDIIAYEHEFQWLHLQDGGWVSAGTEQQYISWEVIPDGEDPPTETPKKIIVGITLRRCGVYNKPQGDKRIGTIDTNTDIRATENIFQWLHLAQGGWVSAGPLQQYIKWEVFEETEIPEPPTDPIEPTDTPLPPDETWPITEIKRNGRIATLLVDWQNPKWDFEPRPITLDRYFAHPQTVTFNTIPREGKGRNVPLTENMTNYLVTLNGEKTKKVILTKGSGWVNVATAQGKVESLSWAGNHVIVKSTTTVNGINFSNIHALNCYETKLDGSFFDKDQRLVLHKFNAINRQGNMMKLADGIDCYTPFISDPNLDNGDMWIRSAYLEMWPDLPFTLSDGTEIIEYELFGYQIYGLRADGKSVLLRDPDGFKTNWKINSPEVPV